MEQVKNTNGFSLLELLITLVIVAILAAITLPSYQAITHKARKLRIQTDMLNLHLQQQNFYLEQQRFGTKFELAIPISNFYEVDIENLTQSSFTITASALAPQQDGSSCDVLTINYELVRQPKTCW